MQDQSDPQTQITCTHSDHRAEAGATIAPVTMLRVRPGAPTESAGTSAGRLFDCASVLITFQLGDTTIWRRLHLLIAESAHLSRRVPKPHVKMEKQRISVSTPSALMEIRSLPNVGRRHPDTWVLDL